VRACAGWGIVTGDGKGRAGLLVWNYSDDGRRSPIPGGNRQGEYRQEGAECQFHGNGSNSWVLFRLLYSTPAPFLQPSRHPGKARAGCRIPRDPIPVDHGSV